jgi:hypothetical protein
MTKQENKPTPTLADFPAYTEAQGRLQALQAELVRVDAELNEPTFEALATIEERALVLAGGGDVEMVDPQPSRAAHYRALSERGKVLREAVKIAETREREARRVASRSIAETVRPRYVALLARMAGLAAELGALADLEAQVRDGLTMEDVAFVGTMPPVAFSAMRLRVPGSSVNRFLNQLEEHYPEAANRKLERRRDG